MNRYLIFGLSVALLGAIMALNNTAIVDISLPLIGVFKTTVANIFVSAGLVLLVALIILGVLEYLSRLTLVAQHREELRKIKEEYESKIEELEYQVERLEREISLIRHKPEPPPVEKGIVIDK